MLVILFLAGRSTTRSKSDACDSLKHFLLYDDIKLSKFVKSDSMSSIHRVVVVIIIDKHKLMIKFKRRCNNMKNKTFHIRIYNTLYHKASLLK